MIISVRSLADDQLAAKVKSQEELLADHKRMQKLDVVFAELEQLPQLISCYSLYLYARLFVYSLHRFLF